MTEKKILRFKQPAEFYYNMSQKLMDNGKYINALAAIRKAVEMQPDDYDYAMCLAETLTELSRYEESNRMIFNLIERREGVNADCFFCLGCNFMGLNDIPKAQESFEKYMEMQPDGEYREEIEDFLYYFDTDELDTYIGDEKEKQAYEQAKLGKQHLDYGEYEKAVEVLEKIDNSTGEMSYAKNNLALAYYCLKDIVKAMEVTKAVLRVNRKNLHANCNMAVFMYETERYTEAEKYVLAAMNQRLDAPEDIYKLAITLCEMGYHEQATPHLRELASLSPYDEKILYYLSAAYHNTGNLREAANLLHSIKKLDHPGVIAEYYIKKINQELDDPDTYVEMGYVYQVPAEEAKEKIKYLNECLKLPDGEFEALWRSNETFTNTVMWGLEYGDESIKKAIAGMVAGFADSKSEQMLRDFLLRRQQPDEVKNDIFVLLKRMNAKEPYIAYIADEVVEVKVGTYDFEGGEMGEEYAKIFKMLYKTIDSYYTEEVLKSTLQVIQVYLDHPVGEVLSASANEVVAAILFVALQSCSQPESLKEVCMRMEASEQEVQKVVDKLEKSQDIAQIGAE